MRVVADIGDFSVTLDHAAKSLDGFANRAAEAGRAMQSAGLLITAAGAAITAPLALAVREAASFEAAMRNAATVLGVTDDQLGLIGKEVLALSQTLPKAATDLAQGLFFVAGSGFKGAEAMGVLRQSAIAASAGLTSTETAAKVIVGAINAFGLTAADAAKVSDVLFQTVASGIITFEDLATEFGPLAASAALLGVSLNDTGIALAAVTRAGLNAAEATTAVSRLFDQLINPGKAMQVVLSELGVSSGQAAIEQFGLAGVLAKVVEVAGKDSQAMFELAGNIRSLRALANLTKNDMALFNAVQTEFATVSGATARAFDQQSKSFEFAFKLLQNNIRVLAISVGTELLPTLTNLVQGVAGVIKTMTDWAAAHPQVVKTLGLIIGGLGAFSIAVGATLGIGGTFLILVGKIPDLIRAASFGIEVLTGVLPKLATAFRVVLAALSGNPIGLALAAIGVAMLLLAPIIIRNWDRIKESFSAAVDFIKAITPLFATIFTPLIGAFQAVLPVATFVLGTILEMIENFVVRTALLVGGFVRVLTAVPLALRGKFSEAADSLKAGLADLGAAFLQSEGASRRFGDSIKSPVSATVSAEAQYKHHVSTVGEVAAAYEQAGKVATQTAEQIELAAKSAGDAAELLSLQQQAAATQTAQQRLQAPGLEEADLQAITEEQARATRAAQEQQLATQIAAQREAIARLSQLGAAGALKRVEAEKVLAQQIVQLENSKLETIQQVATKIVAAEKAAAEERIKTAQHVRTETIAAARATGEAQIAAGEASLARFRLLEETRMGLLRRGVDTFRGIAQTILDVSEGLNKIQLARDEAALSERAKSRARLVAEGALLERDAEEANARELLAIRTANAQREIQAEQQRLAIARTLNQAEVGFAIAEGRSRIAVIQAETQARIAGLHANQQLRLADLEGALAAANAEKEARLDVIRSDVAARVAAGQITQQEAAAITAQINSIQQGFAATVNRIRAEGQASLQATANAQTAIEQEAAARTLSVQTETQSAIAALAQQDTRDRLASAERIQAAERTLADAVVAERDRLRGLGFTDAEIDAQLKPAQTILDRLKALGTEQVGLVQQALTTLSTAYQTFSQQVLGFLQPVIDAMRLLANPELLRQLLTPQGPQAPLQPGAPIGTLPPATPAQPSGMTVNVNGATITLTADKSAVIAEVLAAIMGPEGNRIVADWLRGRPGPRILPA